MKKQTAVQWFKDEINKRIMDNSKYTMTEIFDQALAMEKEQITRAIHYGCSDFGSWKDAEQYYNQTFGS